MVPPTITPEKTYHTTHEMRRTSDGIPERALLLGVLKAVESELARRNFLGLQRCRGTPLWFLAETERNVYLWRNGRGLDDQRSFTFWIDVPALIAKRREQLRRQDGYNPFINPFGGEAADDERALEGEFEYLSILEELSSTVFTQAEALSHASETVRRELSPEPRTVVLLPSNAGASR